MSSSFLVLLEIKIQAGVLIVFRTWFEAHAAPKAADFAKFRREVNARNIYSERAL